MCMVSVVENYGGTRVLPEQWDRSIFTEYQKILKLVAELDAKLGQSNCEDPSKGVWMRQVEKRLEALETN